MKCGEIFLDATRNFYLSCAACKHEITDYNDFKDHVLEFHFDPLESEEIQSAKNLTDENNQCVDPIKTIKNENLDKNLEKHISESWTELKKEESNDDYLSDNEETKTEFSEPMIDYDSNYFDDDEDESTNDSNESGVCDRCDKKFSAKQLAKHKARKKCGQCPVCVYKYTDLYKHLKTHHKDYCEEKRRLGKPIIPKGDRSKAKTEIEEIQKEEVKEESQMEIVEELIKEEIENDETRIEVDNLYEENIDKITCIYCTEKFSKSDYENHKTRRKCGKCPVCFEIVQDIYSHVPNNHTEYSEEKKRQGECVVKRLPIIGEKTFDNPDKIFTCTYCDKTFKTEVFYNHHISKHEQFLNTCKECGMNFQYASGLKKHQRKHTDDRPFKCDICNASFNNDGSLKSHITNKHAVGQKVQCTFQNCGKIFKNKERKRYHELYAHYNERKHLCVDCGLRFKTSGALNKHSKTVHLSYEDREFTCKFCSLKFAFKYELDPHEMMHLGQKRYLCEFCTKGYGKKSHLRRHCLNIHKRDID